MAHELTTRENGFVEMAFTGDRKEIWHGLGQQLSEDSPIEVWRVEAGLDWSAESSPVKYEVSLAQNNGGDSIAETGNVIMEVPDRKLLYRSDNFEPLGIVGNDYKTVQPGQVLEFFDDLTRLHGMKLSTAGSLFGGKRIWALAKTAHKSEIVAGDPVEGYVLLTTSLDGTMSTQARFTSIRVVCNNTLNVALSYAGRNFVKITHHREFDPEAVKIDMGLVNESWSKYIRNLKVLSTARVDEAQMRGQYFKLVADPKKPSDEQSPAVDRMVNRLVERAMTGAGHELGEGTAWGILNGATDMYTHWRGNRDASRQFWDSFHGDHAAKKETLYAQLLQEFVCA